MKEEIMGNPLPLKSLNHISVVCRSVDESLDFYQNVLGFFLIRRPRSFNFDGAWLFNYNIGIHLLQSEDPESTPKARRINPKDNHFLPTLEKKLKDMEIEYVKSKVEEGGIQVDQLFFHDPDSMMIEICNCDNLPVVHLVGKGVGMCSSFSYSVQQKQQLYEKISAIHIEE